MLEEGPRGEGFIGEVLVEFPGAVEAVRLVHYFVLGHEVLEDGVQVEDDLERYKDDEQQHKANVQRLQGSLREATGELNYLR